MKFPKLNTDSLEFNIFQFAKLSKGEPWRWLNKPKYIWVKFKKRRFTWRSTKLNTEQQKLNLFRTVNPRKENQGHKVYISQILHVRRTQIYFRLIKPSSGSYRSFIMFAYLVFTLLKDKISTRGWYNFKKILFPNKARFKTNSSPLSRKESFRKISALC
jgi:hypothetical protein